jgi:hypothetical protein
MIVLPTVTPKFNLFLVTEALEKKLDALVEGGAIIALVYNDARSDDGTYYFKFVDGGRGPVRPINAQALHWVDPQTGKDVFAQYSKGVPPRHIVARSLAVVRQRDIPAPSGELNRDTVAKFVNAVAMVAVEEMQSITPVQTGKLKNSYRIKPAIGEE